MIEIGTINNRNILYERYNADLSWQVHLPQSNWLALIIVEQLEISELEIISETLLSHNVCYTCSVGQQGEIMHDLLDEEIVIREVAKKNSDFDFFTITTWHDTLTDTLYFSSKVADHPTSQVNSLFILDASINGSLHEILDGLKLTT